MAMMWLIQDVMTTIEKRTMVVRTTKMKKTALRIKSNSIYYWQK